MKGFLVAALLALTSCNETTFRYRQGLWTSQEASYDASDPVRLATVYRPLGSEGKALPWVYGVHGGAFMIGGRHDLATYADEFCPLGYAVVSVDYRLTTSPGGVWPAPLRDCQAGLRFFRENAVSYGLDPDRLVVMGGSAGGCLATHLGLEDDPVSPLGRCPRFVDDSGESDFRLLDLGMSNAEQITGLLLGHPGPWTEAELLGPSTIQRARGDADAFVVHGSCSTDTFCQNSDDLVSALQVAGAQVEYHRVEGGGMFARLEQEPTTALHAWLAARLR